MFRIRCNVRVYFIAGYCLYIEAKTQYSCINDSLLNVERHNDAHGTSRTYCNIELATVYGLLYFPTGEWDSIIMQVKT